MKEIGQRRSAAPDGTTGSPCECGHPTEAHADDRGKCQALISGTGAASAFLYPCPCKRFKAAK